MPAFDSGAFDSGAFDIGGGASVDVGLINQAAVAFAPVVALAGDTISLGLIDQTAVAFAPSLSSATTISLGLISRSAIARPPLVSHTTGVTGGGAGGRDHTRVFVAGFGDISPIVVFNECELETAEGGQASVGYLTVRDVGQQRADFVPMSRVLIDRGANTDPIYQGYLIKPSRRFWFDVDYPETLQRKWVLFVADINLLWNRRVVYRQSNPADITGPKYTSDTYDDTALAELFEDWVDLSADDLDTETRVSRVGKINYDQTTYPWNGGQMLGEAVKTIAQLPAAVYGIDSSRRVVYADVDDENAPFVLSDPHIPGWDPAGTPGAEVVGYRESTIIHDGTRLANDAMAWGFGMGSPNGVFRRLQDSASINEHGLWQEAATLYSVYKQATIDKVADSIVNGSPGSRRGRKNDRDSVECVIHRDGLHVGDRVRFISHIWRYEDVIPVRKMKLRFPTPYDVRYELVLSHEIDEWGFQDPPPPFPMPPPWEFPIIIVEPPPIDRICGITDDFEGRTESGIFGVSTSGIEWFAQASVTASLDVAGGKGFMYTAGSAAGSQAIATLGGAVPGEYTVDWDPSVIKTVRFQWNNAAITGSDFDYLLQWGMFRVVGQPEPNIHWSRITEEWRLRLTFGLSDGVLIPDGFFNDSDTYTWVTKDIGGGVLETSISNGTDTYSTTSAYDDSQLQRLKFSIVNTLQFPFTANDRSWIILDVDIPEITRCDYLNAVFPETGRICTDYVGDGSTTTFPAMGLIVPDSADVIVDGLTLTPTVGFDEDVDQLGVTLASAPALGAWVHLCYTVL